ncbi:hypothetical protein SLEP1_g53586 [Rubroshorea leprosula]|uniref:Uncharacterized protein n=1 Tax=Rubroshorea leprosula TaxID=152421 RepID=A0AAV5MDD3_9ROSI|nr:hypothetical protein SLEP1_g53586 [Rubroshorea leprosula]
MDSYMVKHDCSFGKTPSKCSSVEKALIDRGLRRSLTASVFLLSLTIAKSKGKA